MTEREAIRLVETEWWIDCPQRERVKLQLFEDRLIMPFALFHKDVEEVLGRSVWTHEFADIESLRKEFLKERPAPSMQNILNLIPAEKRIVVAL